MLVTGSEGFVGRQLAKALDLALPSGGRLLLGQRDPVGPDSDAIALDLLRAGAVEAVLRRHEPDLIVHLAAQASVGRSSAETAATWGVNVGGTLVLARAAAQIVPCCTLLFASSAEVYGLSYNDGPVTEDTPLRPLSTYAKSKAAAEALLDDVLPPDARLIVVRPTNHSGPGQSRDFVVPAFACQIAAIERGELAALKAGNLDAERDFMDAADVVAAYVALLGRAPELPSRAVFNVASGQPRTVRSVLERLETMAAVPIPVEVDPARARPAEITTAVVDVARLRRAIGWTPSHDIDAMLRATLDECRTRPSG